MLQMEMEQKKELQRKLSMEQKELAQIEIWKNNLLQKIQSQKAARLASKSKKKHKKKGKKRQKSLLVLVKSSPFYKEEAKTATDFLPSIRRGVSNENEIIELLVEKYTNKFNL